MSTIDPERQAAIDRFLMRMRGTLELSEEVLAQHSAKDQRAQEAARLAMEQIQESYALLEQVDDYLKRRT